MKTDIYGAIGVLGYELASHLDHMGGNSQDIIDRYQELYENGQMVDLFTGKQMSVEESAKECMGSLRGELRRLWIKRMSRETASAFMEAFAGMSFSKIVLCEDLEIFPIDISNGWNELHPDEEPVYFYGADSDELP